ncbi:MAG: DNA polymerase III subunit gamma/tau [Actinobacteria bacterium]|uniref:DNA-directed DNA polymerase n=1 Tax=freshwater metagenome TaxID=449393 RepID=A0A6J5YYS2_9ZZZZ|nr:DNA polymerase III subunit gamma/tau [Actinomycetota bacterium]MSX33831.1 DNA polymerase III subunit gamma/tau [Actinomycetota bacterium]MSY25773.1 DNA polymerase III subunit gamma/tau [Actinomycetota bacterium]MSY34681.1 DNA polymerase III subunit gamma/tau [Actinomycetota bacterium]MSZ51635.1 DNA polymerase III subunit gamma/tau [Actinomycetota bacterium]
MSYQSLYRRYRPSRFSEVRGQEHLVSALRNAVTEDRLGHAYLFSGPRGTGKTSTARILAKVLNCQNPEAGEPCCVCDSCLSIDAGTSFDVHELDAASNNGVDSIRDLISSASLATPGRYKVYILDEVHMLSTAASNALLKTLEEPPSHVIFVLATTDPQKVLPTIRSRTQHFEVHLLSAADLEGLVDYVVADAGLELSPEGRSYVLRVGAGSARDTLSALDRVVAAGGIPDSEDAVDELVEALCERDTGRALIAVEGALSRGRNPRVLGEALIARLRDVFLASVGADLSRLTDTDRDRAVEQGRRLSAAGATRALEALGEAFVGIQDALDPRIPLEVALVRLTRDDADVSLSSLADRISRLERDGVVVSTDAATKAPGPARPKALPPPIADDTDDEQVDSSPMPAAGSRPADVAREELRRRTGGEEPIRPSRAAARPPTRPARPGRPGAATAPSAAPSPAAVPAPEPATGLVAEPIGEPVAEPVADLTPEPIVEVAPSAPAAPAPTGGSMPALIDLTSNWSDTLLPSLPQRSRARFSGGHWVDVVDGVAVFGLPNEPHAVRCEECRSEVESALAAHFGAPVPIRLVVDGSAPDPSAPRSVAAARRAATDQNPVDESIDLDDLRNARGASSAGADRIAAVFPGAELVDEN